MAVHTLPVWSMQAVALWLRSLCTSFVGIAKEEMTGKKHGPQACALQAVQALQLVLSGALTAVCCQPD